MKKFTLSMMVVFGLFFSSLAAAPPKSMWKQLHLTPNTQLINFSNPEHCVLDDSDGYEVALALHCGKAHSELIQSIAASLKPGGRALVAVTPSESLEHKVMARYWPNASPALSTDDFLRELTASNLSIKDMTLNSGIRVFQTKKQMLLWFETKLLPLYASKTDNIDETSKSLHAYTDLTKSGRQIHQKELIILVEKLPL